MKRIKTFWVAVVMVAMLGAFAVLAQAQPTNLFFIPDQPGVGGIPPQGLTISCTDTTDPIKINTSCTFVQNGDPESLVCDIPVTFVAFGGTPVLSGFQCREPGGGGGGPLTQEIEQEAESGEVDIAFEVSSSGDYAQQCAAPLQFGETGNLQNGQGALQNGSAFDDLEFGGSTFGFEPSVETACEGAVQQAAAASG